MLSVAQATTQAKRFLLEMFPDALGVRLEEVELDDSDRHWSVTVSFVPADQPPATFAQALTGREGRSYKIIKLDAASGIVKSMKIRTFDELAV